MRRFSRNASIVVARSAAVDAAARADLENVSFRLTPEEDAELRRLHVLVQYGGAAPWLVDRYRSLRARDRRTDVRPLDDTELAEVLPAQHALDQDQEIFAVD
jgi:hypothetical protein